MNNSTSKKRIITNFLKATENEIFLDRYLFALGGASPEEMGYLPRPTKWISWGKRFPNVFLAIWRLVYLVWLCGGGAIYYISQAIQLYWQKGNSEPNMPCTDDDSGYVLALSARVGDIVHTGHIPDMPNNWVTMPWVTLSQVPEGVNCVSVVDLLSLRDVVRAVRDAIFAIYVMRRRKRMSPWLLQSYTAFRWFAVRSAVDKLHGHLLMAEHFDRWAVLVDSSVRNVKFRNMESGLLEKRALTLVQHGAIGGLGKVRGGEQGEEAFNLPQRLNEVSKLYVYARMDELDFKDKVLSKACVKNGVKVNYYQPSITLTNLDGYRGPKILFVGHPVCEALHMHLYKTLKKSFDFKAYYKPHPLSGMSSEVSDLDWSIITDPKCFPLVDILISYPSTLVVEYSALGIPSISHPLNLSAESADEYISLVSGKISALRGLN